MIDMMLEAGFTMEEIEAVMKEFFEERSETK